MVTGAGRGQGTRVRLQKLFPFGTASLRTQTYFRSSLLSTRFGEEKRRPEIRLCPQAREQQGSLKEYWTWDKSQQQRSRNITRYLIKSRNITLIRGRGGEGGLAARPFQIALSTFWTLSRVWSTILHFEHPLAFFRTLGNIWAIFHISSNICLLKHFKAKTVCRSQRESYSRS